MNGIIRITTKTKDFAEISFPDESVFLEYQTVTPQSYPIFPNYLNATNKNRIPDFRSLLYWNSDISITNKNKVIKFFASDHCSDYEIIVKGYNKNNQYVQGKSFIKIEKNEN